MVRRSRFVLRVPNNLPVATVVRRATACQIREVKPSLGVCVVCIRWKVLATMDHSYNTGHEAVNYFRK